MSEDRVTVKVVLVGTAKENDATVARVKAAGATVTSHTRDGKPVN